MSGDGPAFGAITTPQSSWPSPSNELVGKRRKLLGEVASPQVANAPKESPRPPGPEKGGKRGKSDRRHPEDWNYHSQPPPPER